MDWFDVAEDQRGLSFRFVDVQAQWDIRKYATVAAANAYDRLLREGKEEEAAMALVLGCTTGWSYGDLTIKTLESVPSHHYKLVLGRLIDILTPLASKTADALQKASSSP